MRNVGSFAFYACEDLNTIDISDLTAWCQINFEDEFGHPLCNDVGNIYCNGELITEITIPSTVTKIGDYALCWLQELEEVTIENGVTEIGKYAFGACYYIQSITIPASVTKIGEHAFDCCISLTSVYCEAVNPPEGGNQMFLENPSERKIYVPTDSVDAYKSASGWSEYASDIVGYDF